MVEVVDSYCTINPHHNHRADIIAKRSSTHSGQVKHLSISGLGRQCCCFSGVLPELCYVVN